MKKIIKITLVTFLLLGVVGFLFFVYSVSDWLTEFDDAFLFIEGQEGFVLSQSEFEKTSRLLHKWAWGDKHTPKDENFSIISIDGYECVRIWSSQPRALLTSTHPLETYDPSRHQRLTNFSTYNCMKNLDLDNFDGEFYLYGQPFFYDDRWWVYKPFEPRMKLIWFVCADGCSTHWQAFAKPEPVLKSDPIYLEK